MVELIDENEMTQENRLSESRMGTWGLGPGESILLGRSRGIVSIIKFLGHAFYCIEILL